MNKPNYMINILWILEIIAMAWLIFFNISCGKQKVEIPNTAHVVTVIMQVPYQEIATFCDTRYGESSEKAEICFSNYQHFFDSSVGLDLSSIKEFCADNVDKYKDFKDCQKDLLDLLSKG